MKLKIANVSALLLTISLSGMAVATQPTEVVIVQCTPQQNIHDVGQSPGATVPEICAHGNASQPYCAQCVAELLDIGDLVSSVYASDINGFSGQRYTFKQTSNTN